MKTGSISHDALASAVVVARVFLQRAKTTLVTIGRTQCDTKKNGKVILIFLSVFISGCATFSPQPSSASINSLLQTRGAASLNWSNLDSMQSDQKTIDTLLAEPLGVDAAVAIALLRSPKLQHEYARLGYARADVLEAIQIANPSISLLRQSSKPIEGINRTIGITMPLLDLITLPARKKSANADSERAKFAIADSILNLAFDVESTWYGLIGAEQICKMRAAVSDATNLSAELAQRFYQAGNITELQLKQEQAAASEAKLALGAAKILAAKQRLALNTLLGLDANKFAWTTPDQLPLPVVHEDNVDELIDIARAKNLQLLAAQKRVLQAQATEQATRHWYWLGDSLIGYEREKAADGERLNGPAIELELPLFNQGQAQKARTRAALIEANASLREANLSIENSIRANANALGMQRAAIDIYREALIPQRELVLARSQQEQNFMLIGVFELIQAKAKQYDAYQAYFETLSHYWQARVELARSVGERLPSDAEIKARETESHAMGASDMLISTEDGQEKNHAGHETAKKHVHDHTDPSTGNNKTQESEHEAHSHQEAPL